MLEILMSLAIALSSPNDYVESNPTQNIEATEQVAEIEPENTYTIIRTDSSQPIINASAGLVMDLETETILYQKNIYDKTQIASLTKLMTAKIIIEENSLSEVVTVPFTATETGGSVMGLVAGEQITVESLLNGLLIQSGNDAAVALAIHNSGSVKNFVDKMNLKAKSLNLTNTSFQNPIGFDHVENFSTPYDLAILAKNVYQYPKIKSIVSKPSETVYSVDQKFSHNIESTNELLDSYLNVVGLKTGQTGGAGECFIAITDSEHPTLSIVLGSNQRFNDSKILLDWSKNKFEYK